MFPGPGINSQWEPEVAGTRQDIISDYVSMDSYSFEVNDASFYKPGDNIIIYHPCLQLWFDTLDGGGTAGDPPGSPVNSPLYSTASLRLWRGTV